MKKADYIQRHNIHIRPVNAEDRAAARTDYQRISAFILEYAGVEFYSKNFPTLSDCKAIVDYTKRSPLDYGTTCGRRATA